MIQAGSPRSRAFAVLLFCCTLAAPSAAHTASAYDQPAPGPALSLDALDPILAELAPTETQVVSLWDKLWDWLDELLDPAGDNEDPPWFRDFRVSDTIARWIFYIAGALIVLLAVGIVANELRHANAFRRRRKHGTGPLTTPDVAASTTVEDLLSLPLSEQPGVLLKLIVARLALARVTDRQESLTHREIVHATQSLEPAQSQPLHKVANLAERIRYGGRLPEEHEIEPVVGAGRALLSKLVESP